MKQTAFLSLVILSFFFFTGIGRADAKPAAAKKATVEEVYRLINRYRQGRGLKPLKINETINKAAAKHSRNMANGSVPMGHDGFDARYEKLTSTVPNATGMAENVAYNSGSAAQVVDGWIHSPVHKKNIEGNYDLTGIGIATSSSGRVYYTQIFVKN